MRLIRIPVAKELIEQVDRLTGKQRRSSFVQEAIIEKLAREGLTGALSEARGILDLEDYPEWKTPEATSAWVTEVRHLDNDRLAEVFRDRKP